MTLQEQFNAIKNGKGNKVQFLKQARSLFPQYLNQYSDFNTSVNVLKSKQIINEAVGGVVTKGFNITNWKQIFEAEVKAEEKTTSKEAADANKNAYQPSNVKNADNINFNEILKGYLAELGDVKNAGKTGDELKEIAVKNLAKDPLFYTKNGEFGIKGVGYTTEAPGLGEPKEAKGKHKSSGYGDIDKEIKVKANVKDSLGSQEAKDSMPKKVKEMTTTPQSSAGVKKMKMPGAEKKMKLQENKETNDKKIARYEEYTYTLNGKEVKPEIAFYDNILKAELDGKIYKIGDPVNNKIELTSIKGKTGMYTESESKLRSVIAKLIKEELNEGSIKFIPGRVYASKNGKLTYIGVVPPGGSHKGQQNPTQENLYLFADENGKKGFGFTMEQLKQAKMDPMSTKGDFGNLPDGNVVSADGLGSLLDMIKNATVNKTLSASDNLNENESPVQKGDILYHKNSDSTLEVVEVSPTNIKMKVTKISDKTPSYIKVGQSSKTNPSAIGKTYTKK